MASTGKCSCKLFGVVCRCHGLDRDEIQEIADEQMILDLMMPGTAIILD